MAENAPIAVVAALALVGVLVWRLRSLGFRALRSQSIGIASGLFWGVLAAVLVSLAWGFYYSRFMPSWYRYAAPLGAVALYSALGLAIRWIALRLPGNPVIAFCLVGGLESIPEHAVGIYRFDILKIPVLQGSTAASIFTFAYFEYVVYWGATLTLAVGVDRLLARLEAGGARAPRGQQ
jgi:hypothetical protein